MNRNQTPCASLKPVLMSCELICLTLLCVVTPDAFEGAKLDIMPHNRYNTYIL